MTDETRSGVSPVDPLGKLRWSGRWAAAVAAALVAGWVASRLAEALAQLLGPLALPAQIEAVRQLAEAAFLAPAVLGLLGVGLFWGLERARGDREVDELGRLDAISAAATVVAWFGIRAPWWGLVLAVWFAGSTLSPLGRVGLLGLAVALQSTSEAIGIHRLAETGRLADGWVLPPWPTAPSMALWLAAGLEAVLIGIGFAFLGPSLTALVVALAVHAAGLPQLVGLSRPGNPHTPL